VVSLGVAVVAAWYILSRRGVARAVAAGLAALALVVFAVVVIVSESLIVLAVGLGLAAVSIAAASYALSSPAAARAIERAPAAHHPVLLMNLKSGGGKAERFGLPYQLTHLRRGTRDRIDGGCVRGVVSLQVETAADAEKLAALEAAGQVQRFPGFNEWAASEFEARSAGPVEIGVDGEALSLQPPLRFVIRPSALTVRLPRMAPGRSPGARTVRFAAKPTVTALRYTVLGRPMRAG
jgi:hypothetical protein